jgi:hypothetical protein
MSLENPVASTLSSPSAVGSAMSASSRIASAHFPSRESSLAFPDPRRTGGDPSIARR